MNKNIKKILIVTDYFQPKLWYTPTFLAKEYIKKWYEVLVLTSNYYFPFPNYETTSWKILWPRKQKVWYKVEEWIPTKREKLKFEFFTRAYFENIEKNVKQFSPDIVIVNGISNITAIIFARLKKKYWFKLTCFDSNLMSIINQWRKVKEIFYFMFRILFSRYLEKRVDKFVWVQEETCEIINKYYWISKNRIEFIPLWTDCDKFKFDVKEREKIRSKYNIPENSIVLIYTWKLILDKWYDLLIKSTSKIAHENRNVYVIIIGSGPKELIDKMNDYIRDVADNYKFIDFVKNVELFKYYSASDIWIWPLQESVTMVEAAACNVPFIANDKIWTKLRISNDNALLYKQWDVKDLYEKIKYLVENPKERVAMWKRWRMLVEEKLSRDSISDKYLYFN